MLRRETLAKASFSPDDCGIHGILPPTRFEKRAIAIDPRNGLCLSALHDAAFDSGLITLDESLRLVLGKRLTAHFPQPVLEQNFVPFVGKAIRFPEKLAEPNHAFLAYHRQSVFFG